MKRKAINTDSDRLINSLKLGSDEGYELIRRAYSGKMHDLAFSYFGHKSLSSKITDDALIKIWQEKNIQKENYDFRSLITALTNNIISETINNPAEQRPDEIPAFCLGVNPNDERDRLIDNFQQTIIGAVLELPPSQQIIFNLRSSGMADAEIAGQKELSIKEVKSELTNAEKIVREYLNKHPDFAFMFLLMVITG